MILSSKAASSAITTAVPPRLAVALMLAPILSFVELRGTAAKPYMAIELDSGSKFMQVLECTRTYHEHGCVQQVCVVHTDVCVYTRVKRQVFVSRHIRISVAR